MTKEQLDNMPPLPDQLEDLSRDKRDHIRIYAISYAEQRTGELYAAMNALQRHHEQQTQAMALRLITAHGENDELAAQIKELRAEVERLNRAIEMLSENARK